MERMLEESLERLSVEYIDIYWIHHPSDVEKWTRDMIPQAKSGRIRAVGLSNHSLAELKRGL